MRRTILSEGERSRILNLHKKAILVENPPQVPIPNTISSMANTLGRMDAVRYKEVMDNLAKLKEGGDLNALSEHLEFLLQIVRSTQNNSLKNAILPELEKIYQETRQMSAGPKY